MWWPCWCRKQQVRLALAHWLRSWVLGVSLTNISQGPKSHLVQKAFWHPTNGISYWGNPKHCWLWVKKNTLENHRWMGLVFRLPYRACFGYCTLYFWPQSPVGFSSIGLSSFFFWGTHLPIDPSPSSPTHQPKPLKRFFAFHMCRDRFTTWTFLWATSCIVVVFWVVLGSSRVRLRALSGTDCLELLPWLTSSRSSLRSPGIPCTSRTSKNGQPVPKKKLRSSFSICEACSLPSFLLALCLSTVLTLLHA